MKGLFRYDGPALRFLGKVGDCVILSAFWLLFSLPVITLGASSTALYYSVHKVLRRDEERTWSAFWTSFRSNFRQATVIWLVLLLVFYVLGLSLYSAYTMFTLNRLSLGMLIGLTLILAAAIMWALYLFPCVARFQNTTAKILKLCAGIAVFNIYWSFVLLIIFGATVYLSVYLPGGFLVLPAVGTFISSIILEKVFQKYTGNEV